MTEIPDRNIHSKTAIIIAGPTAVGKTAISIEAAKRLNTSIISADSRQCYQEMTIGTAKPSEEELAAVPHYFINEFPFTAWITAADYEALALKYLEEIFTTRDVAVVTGGTGLYIKALCEGLDEMPSVDEAIAEEVNKTYQEKGLDWLKDTLEQEDTLFYTKGETKNPARMLRALIFKRSTGQSLTSFQSKTVKQRPFSIVKIGLELPREALYERINKRVDQMMDQRLLEETTRLFPFRNLKNLQTVGYTELFEHLEGKYSLPRAIEKIKQHTRNYAKRQMTWFKKDKEISWFDAGDPEVVNNILGRLVK